MKWNNYNYFCVHDVYKSIQYTTTISGEQIKNKNQFNFECNYFIIPILFLLEYSRQTHSFEIIYTYIEIA